jgi:hypothetical protein
VSFELSIDLNGNRIKVGPTALGGGTAASSLASPQKGITAYDGKGGVSGPGTDIGGGGLGGNVTVIGPIVVGGAGHIFNANAGAVSTAAGALSTEDPGGVGGPGTDIGGVGGPGTDIGGVGGPGGVTVIGPIVIVNGGSAVPSFIPADAIKAPLDMQEQQEDQWCWAAVSVSVDRYFTKNQSPWTQCRIASDQLGGSCCQNPDSETCDQPWFLEKALGKMNRMPDGPRTGQLSFVEVCQQLAKGRPVCVRIAWRGNGAHFVAITGQMVTSSGVEMLVVADPFWGTSMVSYDSFVSDYLGAGQWTTSYLP